MYVNETIELNLSGYNLFIVIYSFTFILSVDCIRDL